MPGVQSGDIDSRLVWLSGSSNALASAVFGQFATEVKAAAIFKHLLGTDSISSHESVFTAPAALRLALGASCNCVTAQLFIASDLPVCSNVVLLT
jgi:hypothetical protein